MYIVPITYIFSIFAFFKNIVYEFIKFHNRFSRRGELQTQMEIVLLGCQIAKL